MLINKLKIVLLFALSFFMILTRGSHITTLYSLPDASLVIFLIGGIYLSQARYFILLFLLGSFIDFGSAAIDPRLGFCLTKGYWGLIPAYGVMWLTGYYLNKYKYLQSPLAFISSITGSIILAFMISTQTYYIFSDRFNHPSLFESIHYGWNYLPDYFLYSFSYAAIFWLIQNFMSKNKFFSHYISKLEIL